MKGYIYVLERDGKMIDETSIDENDNSYDLIICYHVLEHIANDRKAIIELLRILKKGGTCIIQTPFKDGEIFENSEIRSPEERQKYYGQSDHVRIYSVDGLKKRLTESGFAVEILDFVEIKPNRFGFPKNESILIAKKH